MPTLILIDLQQGMQAPSLPPRNNPQAETHALRLLSAWRVAGHPVVHVRHISRQPGSVFWPGQPGCEFQPALAPLPGEAVFEKNVPCAFATSGLERWLRVRGQAQLVFAGVSTNNSVEASVRSAGCLGFSAWVVGDACFTFDLRGAEGRHWPAAEVHAQALANLALDYAQVVGSAEALAMLAQ
ncbi:isochorismatase family protein [Pseudomonas sp. NPDC007930]|uniref:cysteine hydrolase family protein n=1 Tax=Pseudomonas sp. NPDC007930 TaxID=3364417 RepID=UPI0036ED3BE4